MSHLHFILLIPHHSIQTQKCNECLKYRRTIKKCPIKHYFCFFEVHKKNKDTYNIDNRCMPQKYYIFTLTSSVNNVALQTVRVFRLLKSHWDKLISSILTNILKFTVPVNHGQFFKAFMSVWSANTNTLQVSANLHGHCCWPLVLLVQCSIELASQSMHTIIIYLKQLAEATVSDNDTKISTRFATNT